MSLYFFIFLPVWGLPEEGNNTGDFKLMEFGMPFPLLISKIEHSDCVSYSDCCFGDKQISMFCTHGHHSGWAFILKQSFCSHQALRLITYTCWMCRRLMPHARTVILHVVAPSNSMVPKTTVMTVTMVGEWWKSHFNKGMHLLQSGTPFPLPFLKQI